MSKQKMLAARELIQEKRYAEARALLKTIDDPTAKAWLKKLDAIAPEKKKSGGKLVYITAAVVLLSIVIIAATLIARQNSTDEASQNALAQVPTQIELPSATPTLTPSPTETVECPAEMWWDDAEQYLLDFLGYTDVAMETARISVGDVLINMQRSKRDFERLDVHLCYADAQNSIVTGMEHVIKGFGEFQSDLLLTVNLDILYARESISTGLNQLEQIGLAVYDDAEEALNIQFGDWSLNGLNRLGTMSVTCTSDEFTVWSNEVKNIARFLPVDVGDLFTLEGRTVERIFIQDCGA